MNSNTSAAERVLNLVIALLNTSVPMTKQQIFQRVNGYDANTNDAAQSKLLERDKALLREIGISLTTFGTDGHGEDVGYRIVTDDGEAPLVSFSSAEYAVLGLAAGLWRGNKLHDTAARGLSKLRSYTEPDVASVEGEGADSSFGEDLMTSLSPRLRTISIDYDDWLKAIFERRRVTFTYRAANSGVETLRSVEPWQLRVRSGGWYLVGFDVDRDAPRIFHLSRVIASPKISSQSGEFPAVTPEALNGALSGLVGAAELFAVLAILPERAGALRARARTPGTAAGASNPSLGSARGLAGRDLIHVPFRNLKEFAAEVAGYGDGVVVISPEDLRQSVISRLRAAVSVGTPSTTGEDV